MKKSSMVFFKRVVRLLSVVLLLAAVHGGALEETVEAQQNYPAPVISRVAPTEIEVGKSIELNVQGKYFLQGAKLSFYPSTGISLSWIEVLSSVEMSAGIVVDSGAPIGSKDVIVTNPDGQHYVAKGAFSLKSAVSLPPVIVSISPNRVVNGESIGLIISGKHFQQGAKLFFNPSTGITVNQVKVSSSEAMSVGIAIAEDAPSGVRDVTITNPDQQSYTARAVFQIETKSSVPQPLPPSPSVPSPTIILPPTITGISPAEGDAGETVELVVSGKYFTAESRLSFSPPIGMSLIAVEVLSPEKIRVRLAIDKDASTGARDITVTNPDEQRHTVEGAFFIKAGVVPSSVITQIPPAEVAGGKTVEPPEPAIKNIPSQNKTQRFHRSAHRLIAGIKNKVTRWIQGVRISISKKTTEEVQRSAFSQIKRPLVSRPVCPEPAVVNYRTLHIKPGTAMKHTDASPDGSTTRPFPTIADALARAEELGYEGVEVVVSRGTYTGDLNITRPTKITGESKTGTKIVGSIINNSPYGLMLDTLSISGPSTTDGVAGRGGAVLVNNICASTTVSHVIITAPQKYGIAQTGGKLVLSDVKVRDTKASPGDESSGAAAYLSHVDATFIHVVIERSGRFGIRQIGGSLILSGTFIFDTQTREEFSKAGTGIYTNDGARTDISDSYVTGSLSSALIIQGVGTQASVRWAAIFDNKSNPWLMREHALTPPPGSPMPEVRWVPGGYGAIEVQDGALLILNDSQVTDNQYMGMRVANGAQARITNTLFSHMRRIPDIESGGGINIQAKNDGYVYLENVVSSYADLCGLQLYGGTADYHVGEVSGCVP
jgi:hypothetical protein